MRTCVFRINSWGKKGGSSVMVLRSLAFDQKCVSFVPLVVIPSFSVVCQEFLYFFFFSTRLYQPLSTPFLLSYFLPSAAFHPTPLSVKKKPCDDIPCSLCFPGKNTRSSVASLRHGAEHRIVAADGGPVLVVLRFRVAHLVEFGLGKGRKIFF